MAAEGSSYQHSADTSAWQHDVTSSPKKTASWRGSAMPTGQPALLPSTSAEAEAGASASVDGDDRVLKHGTAQMRRDGYYLEKKQEVPLHRIQMDVRDSRELQRRQPGRCASLGQRRGCLCHRGTRPRTRRAAPRQPSRLSLASGLARFAILSFFLAFYVRKCLNRGSDGLLFRRSSFFHGSKAENHDALKGENTSSSSGPLSGGSFRRLAGEEPSSRLAGTDGKREDPEQALCSAIEASAHASRLAATQPIAEDSDDEIPQGPDASDQGEATPPGHAEQPMIEDLAPTGPLSPTEAVPEEWDPMHTLHQWVAEGALRSSTEETGFRGQRSEEGGEGVSPWQARDREADLSVPSPLFESEEPLGRFGFPEARDAHAHLILSNEIFMTLPRAEFTQSRIANTHEKASWMEALELEESQRLQALKTTMDACEAAKYPSSGQLDALLIEVIKGQLTLMRATRVFPSSSLGRQLDKSAALTHSPTAALACRLRRCWKALGVTPLTQKVLLRTAIRVTSFRTRDVRAALFSGLTPRLRRERDPQAGAAFNAEGPVYAAAVQSWSPLAAMQAWMTSGDLHLSAEDRRGVLGRFLAEEIPVQTSKGLSQAPANNPDTGGPLSPPEFSRTHTRRDEGMQYLRLSNAVALSLSRNDFAFCRLATADEQHLWMSSLEEEEDQTLRSLSASMEAIQGENPTVEQIDSLLIAAFQGQLTLMRASRVFPHRFSTKRVSVFFAAGHHKTAELACQLHKCWSHLGVSGSVLQSILQQCVFSAGTQTREVRLRLAGGVSPSRRRGIDPKAQAAFAAEGKALRTTIATWKPVAKLREWLSNGYLSLGAEEKSGILGRFLAEETGTAQTEPPRETAAAGPPIQNGDEYEQISIANDIARLLLRNDVSQSRVATLEESDLWIHDLEAEEMERLHSLAATRTAFEADPTTDRLNDLLTAAFRSQVTLMRASRVFPDRPGCRGIAMGPALAHSATAALAGQLRDCWRALGVTSPTLSALLRGVVATVGSQTRASRAKLFVDLVPRVRRGVDPKAQEAFVAEGEAFAAALNTWAPLQILQLWVAQGDLKLEEEDRGGVLARFLQSGGAPSPDDDAEKSADAPQETEEGVTWTGVPSESPPLPESPSERVSSVETQHAATHLTLSNEVANALPRHDLTHCRKATAEERSSWLRGLEAEEKERLASLRASLNALQNENHPTAAQLNALLTAAYQGQLTLMRASRVFPQRGSGKCTNVRRALRHGATASLASQLHLCWKALGVTPSTLKTLLQEAVFTAGARTRSTRGQLIVGLVPSLRRGVDPQAQAAFESEGPVFAAAVASWNPLSLLRQWTDDGVLKLRKEDKEGLLGRFLDGASSIPPGDHAGRSAELSQASAADMPVQSTKSSSSSVSKTTAKFPQDRPFRTVDAAAFLSLSTAVARELDRGTFTHAHVATAAEREVWTDILVAEEAERFESLTASMKAFDGEENPTSDRINNVLASAILGQLTLLRMSRVLPTSHSTKCLNATRALAHPPTATLAAALRQSWNALGVTDSTVKALLCKVVLVIGRETWAPRERLYLRLKRQSSEEPPSHEALAPEASVFSAAIAAWDPVTRLRQWIAAGDLTLNRVDMSGVLGRLLAGGSDGAQGEAALSHSAVDAVTRRAGDPSVQAWLFRPLGQEESLAPPASAMFQGDRTQVEARSSHNAGQSVTGRGDLSQRASVSQPLEPGEPEEPPVSPWFEELFQLSWPGTEGEGASGETSERSIETNQVHLIDEYRDPGLMPSFPAQQTSAVVQPEAVSEGDEGFPRKKSKASKGTYEGSLINESRSSTPTLSPSDSEGSAVVQPVSLTEDSADEGPPRKKSKFWTGVDNDGQATEPASSSDASTTPSPVSPIETSTGLQPVPVSGADSPVGVAAESSAAHAQAAGAWPGAEQAELLTSPRAGRQWGPQGPSLDSHAPASQDTPQLVHHHSSSSTSPRLAPEHQRADVGQDVAVADRTLAPYGESMTSLRALGLTESHCSTESLARQGQILIEMMKAADLHLPDFAGAASAYAGVGLEQLRSLRSDLAGQLERAYSAAAAATHEWGESCRRVHHKWKRFKARLRQLTAVTLFMTGQLGNTQQP